MIRCASGQSTETVSSDLAEHDPRFHLSCCGGHLSRGVQGLAHTNEGTP